MNSKMDYKSLIKDGKSYVMYPNSPWKIDETSHVFQVNENSFEFVTNSVKDAILALAIELDYPPRAILKDIPNQEEFETDILDRKLLEGREFISKWDFLITSHWINPNKEHPNWSPIWDYRSVIVSPEKLATVVKWRIHEKEAQVDQLISLDEELRE